MKTVARLLLLIALLTIMAMVMSCSAKLNLTQADRVEKERVKYWRFRANDNDRKVYEVTAIAAYSFYKKKTE